MVAAWGTPGHLTVHEPPLCGQLNEPPNSQVLISGLLNLPTNTLNNHTPFIALIRIKKCSCYNSINFRRPSPTPAPLPKCTIGPNVRAKDCSQRESQLRATFQCLTSSLPILSISLMEEHCKAGLDPREGLQRHETGECRQ